MFYQLNVFLIQIFKFNITTKALVWNCCSFGHPPPPVMRNKPQAFVQYSYRTILVGWVSYYKFLQLKFWCQILTAFRYSIHIAFTEDSPQSSLCCAYRSWNINEEWIAINTHNLKKWVRDNVHNFVVSPHKESPERQRNQPCISIDSCCSYGHCKEICFSTKNHEVQEGYGSIIGSYGLQVVLDNMSILLKLYLSSWNQLFRLFLLPESNT